MSSYGTPRVDHDGKQLIDIRSLNQPVKHMLHQSPELLAQQTSFSISTNFDAVTADTTSPSSDDDAKSAEFLIML